MGRGRAKAKQTKVARDLKYRNYSTDFTSLERELRGDPYEPVAAAAAESPDSPESPEELGPDVPDDDQYSDLVDRYADFGTDEEIRRIG